MGPLTDASATSGRPSGVSMGSLKEKTINHRKLNLITKFFENLFDKRFLVFLQFWGTILYLRSSFDSQVQLCNRTIQINATKILLNATSPLVIDVA